VNEINERNKVNEVKLNEIYMKHCCKRCPNQKCGARIAMVSGGCSQVQCTQCWQWFCWVCLQQAKGQKHYKENPNHWSDEGHLQPEDVTLDLIKRFFGTDHDPYVNIKLCVRCPSCGNINQKHGRKNFLTCENCQATFCYICNKAVNSVAHYQGQATCHEESDPQHDL